MIFFQPDVYKSSTLKPTMLQHPKYDSESILHCPHDKSHQHKTDRKFPVVEVRSNPGILKNEIDYLSVFIDAILHFQFIAKCIRKAVFNHNYRKTSL